jgi:poly(3-hydroxyalkanoate) synthetase
MAMPIGKILSMVKKYSKAYSTVDKRIKELNLELAKDSVGTPLIIIQDWTNEKDIVRLHIKEAIELKSMIDRLVLDWLEWKQFDKGDDDE